MKKFFLFLLILVIIGAGGAALFRYKPQTFAQVKGEAESVVTLMKREVESVAGEVFSLKDRLFKSEEEEVVPFRFAEVAKGEIFSRISTTGTVNPVSSVTVSTQVSGTIQDLPLEVTSKVQAGDLVARLDQDLFKAELLQAEARLDRAEANLAKEKAGVQMQKARIEASIAGTRSSFKNLEEKYRRNQNLFKRNLISKDAFQTIKAEYQLASARFREESARVDEFAVKQANIKASGAEVKQAQAELQMARVKLDRSVIRAPISGVVIKKTVQAGQTVAANFSSPALVTIAELTSMKVDAWVDEADIGRVKVGQDVEFQVDSYPDRVFRGKVVRIFPAPEIKDNVVTYDTEIQVNNDDLALKPGMTANVTIVLAKKNDVLIVPAAALRIRGPELRKFYPDMPLQGQDRRSSEEQRRRFLEGKGAVWVFRDNQPERAGIRIGATDAKNMEILEGLEEGDQVILGIRADVAKKIARSRGRRSSRG